MKNLIHAHPIFWALVILFVLPRPAASQMVINTLSDLQNINNNLSGNYFLGADIDASGMSFAPIGQSCNLSGPGCFTGILDGAGYTISNLSIQSSSEFGGLFAFMDGTVENLSLANVNIVSIPSAFVGAIAGFSAGGIERVSVTGTVAGRSGFVGGLVGDNEGSISQSDSTAAVNGLNGYVGGLTAINDGTITQSHSTGTASGGGLGGGWA